MHTAKSFEEALAICEQMPDRNRAAVVRHAVMLRMHTAGEMPLDHLAKHLSALLADEAFVRFAADILSGNAVSDLG